jgi:hypothetical protein
MVKNLRSSNIITGERKIEIHQERKKERKKERKNKQKEKQRKQRKQRHLNKDR